MSCRCGCNFHAQFKYITQTHMQYITHATHTTHTTDWNGRIRKSIMVSIADTFNFRMNVFGCLLCALLTDQSSFHHYIFSFLLPDLIRFGCMAPRPVKIYTFDRTQSFSHKHHQFNHLSQFTHTHIHTQKLKYYYSDMQCVCFFIECRQPNRRYWNKTKNEETKNWSRFVYMFNVYVQCLMFIWDLKSFVQLTIDMQSFIVHRSSCICIYVYQNVCI